MVMAWLTMIPEQAFNHYRLYGPGGPYENEYDETGLMRALEIGDARASSLINRGLNQQVSENKALRATDPLAYDVDIIMADMVSGYKTTFEAGAALRALQAQYGASQSQMLDAMAKSPVRSGATRQQNLNVLTQAVAVEVPRVVADAGATKPPLSPADVRTGITTPVVKVPVTPSETPTPTPVSASNVLPLALAAVAFYLLG